MKQLILSITLLFFFSCFENKSAQQEDLPVNIFNAIKNHDLEEVIESYRTDKSVVPILANVRVLPAILNVGKKTIFLIDLLIPNNFWSGKFVFQLLKTTLYLFNFCEHNDTLPCFVIFVKNPPLYHRRGEGCRLVKLINIGVI